MPIQGPQWTEFLTCPICLWEFSRERGPVSLSCGHTICKTCLQELHRKRCPFDQSAIGLDLDQLPLNWALLQLVTAGGGDLKRPSAAPPAGLSSSQHQAYLTAIQCIEELALFLKPLPPGGGSGGAGGPSVLSRSMQRKLVTIVTCQLLEPEGRCRVLRACRSLGERTVTELILHHQNPTQLSANLWAAVRARGCQFLGPAMQEEVLRLVLLALEEGYALSRKVLVMFVVQRLEPHFPQASKTSIGHVVQLLYRASCFKVTKREGDSSLMQLKEEFRSYETLRREHDAQIVQIAMEAGLRIAPDQWSSLLYGDVAHKSHMQSIMDKLQSPSSFNQSIQELIISLQKTGDPAGLSQTRQRLQTLAALDPTPESVEADWSQVVSALEAVVEVVRVLINFVHNHGSRRVHVDTQHAHNAKYKTSLCRDLKQRGTCPRGPACTFAHSEEELERYRAKSRRPKKSEGPPQVRPGGAAAPLAAAPVPVVAPSALSGVPLRAQKVAQPVGYQMQAAQPAQQQRVVGLVSPPAVPVGLAAAPQIVHAVARLPYPVEYYTPVCSPGPIQLVQPPTAVYTPQQVQNQPQPVQQPQAGQHLQPGQQLKLGQQLQSGQQLQPGQQTHPGQQLQPGQQPHPGQQLQPGLHPHPGQQLQPGQQPHPGQQLQPGQQPQAGQQLQLGQHLQLGQQPHSGQQLQPGQQPQAGQQLQLGQHLQLGQQLHPGQQPHPVQQIHLGQQPHLGQQLHPGQQPHLGQQPHPGQQLQPGQQPHTGQQLQPGQRSQQGQQLQQVAQVQPAQGQPVPQPQAVPQLQQAHQGPPTAQPQPVSQRERQRKPAAVQVQPPMVQRQQQMVAHNLAQLQSPPRPGLAITSLSSSGSMASAPLASSGHQTPGMPLNVKPPSLASKSLTALKQRKQEILHQLENISCPADDDDAASDGADATPPPVSGMPPPTSVVAEANEAQPKHYSIWTSSDNFFQALKSSLATYQSTKSRGTDTGPVYSNVRVASNEDEYIPFTSATSGVYGPISRTERASTTPSRPVQVSALSAGTIPTEAVSHQPLPMPGHVIPQNFMQICDPYLYNGGVYQLVATDGVSMSYNTIGHGVLDPPGLQMMDLKPSGDRPSDPLPLSSNREGNRMAAENVRLKNELESLERKFQDGMTMPTLQQREAREVIQPALVEGQLEKDLIRELWFIEHGIEEKQRENKLNIRASFASRAVAVNPQCHGLMPSSNPVLTSPSSFNNFNAAYQGPPPHNSQAFTSGHRDVMSSWSVNSTCTHSLGASSHSLGVGSHSRGASSHSLGAGSHSLGASSHSLGVGSHSLGASDAPCAGNAFTGVITTAYYDDTADITSQAFGTANSSAEAWGFHEEYESPALPGSTWAYNGDNYY